MKCNMDQPDCIHLLPCRQGIYHFQGEALLFPSPRFTGSPCLSPTPTQGLLLRDYSSELEKRSFCLFSHFKAPRMGWQNKNQPSRVSVEGPASPGRVGWPGGPGAPPGSLLRLEDIILHPSLPSTGWILLVNNIIRHLSPLGEVCAQLLHRAAREQLAHSAGAQRLLHAVRPKRYPAGRQRRDYQRLYLGVLGKMTWVRTRRWRSRC